MEIFIILLIHQNAQSHRAWLTILFFRFNFYIVLDIFIPLLLHNQNQSRRARLQFPSRTPELILSIDLLVSSFLLPFAQLFVMDIVIFHLIIKLIVLAFNFPSFCRFSIVLNIDIVLLFFIMPNRVELGL
jgi:hypothetical protein